MRNKSFKFAVTSLAGTSPENILQILRLHRVDPRFYLKFLLSFLIAVVFGVFRVMESLFWHRRIRDYRLKEPPVFIIGFNRSGTTLLHNLLCQDPQAGYTPTVQTVFPQIFLSQQRWLVPLSNLFLPEKRPFDGVPMHMNFPQEEEFALANLQPYSIYNFFLFPNDFERITETEYFPEALPPKALERWKQEYRRLVVKSLLYTGGTRYISKNPQHIPRLDILREMYPDSYFIFLYRNPYEVAESFHCFILSVIPGIQIQKAPPDQIREAAVKLYALAMRRYFTYRETAVQSRILEIRIEEFMNRKIETLKIVYDFCGMDGFDAAKPLFEQYLAAHAKPPHETKEIHPATVRLVNQYAADIVQRFGYPSRTADENGKALPAGA